MRNIQTQLADNIARVTSQQESIRQELSESMRELQSAQQSIAHRSHTASNVVVLDTGAESTTIGRGAWHVVGRKTGVTMFLSGPTPGLGTTEYPIADGITAVVTKSGEVALLGVTGATYNSDPKQREALINPYTLIGAGVDVCITPKKFGGRQSLVLEDEVILLDYDP